MRRTPESEKKARDEALGPAQPLAGVKILVADDDEDIRELVCHALASAGAAVTEAADGIEAQAALALGPADIVVTDIRMPRCDGIQLIRHLKALPNPPDIIVMTGFFDIPSETIIELGVREVLSKPFDARDVVKSIEALVRSRKRGVKGGPLKK